MRILSSSTSSEHWLTLMTCTVCAHTPDDSPVYKCNLGHTICYPCFQRLVVAGGMPVCGVCESDKFTRHDVSPDFLRKLKTKPGIGRPHRYTLERTCLNGGQQLVRNGGVDDSVTVEQLFQLPSCKIQQLFDETTKERIRGMNFDSAADMRSQLNLKNERRDEEVCTVYTLEDKSNSKIWLKKCNRDSSSIYNFENVGGGIQAMQSRKPLKCPHDPCNKIIAVSSFQTHFKYEHCDFERFDAERGKELRLNFNPTIIEHDKTICLGIIRLHDGNCNSGCSGGSITKIARKFNRKQEVDTFWVMVSGSPDDRPEHAYAVVWLFSNNGQFYNCTIELSSVHDVMTVTTLCGVNAMHESQSIADITLRLNCLFLTHGTIASMLGYSPKLKLRITIF
ncbi:PREDICTED: uncharacterized protein LOC108557543 [Nicrophorus vespilloides]|uniref:Uncharacterized protein LOC108557543 n=1 Tax=Nicrophorus vespilloides TaxID=110193 RepID=A0ABM1M4T2_NICVS|nr:PREDICTED: uncharacterized protein LOC108557543 [Nicrophorus vespilloides]